MKVIIASCGLEVRESENFVCPFICRREEMKEKRPGYGSCQVNLQIGTNVCMDSIDFDEIDEY